MITRLPSGIEADHLREARRFPAGTLAIIVLGALIAAALGGLLGGTGPDRLRADNAMAELVVEVPGTLRSGMFFETTIAVETHARFADARLAMTPALWRSITINTEMPQPGEEDYADGYFRLHYGALEPGDRIELKLDAQINPDLFAGTRGEVVLFEGDRAITRVPVHLRVLP